MDRFLWVVGNPQLQSAEHDVIQQRGIRIYDGENRVSQLNYNNNKSLFKCQDYLACIN